MSADLLSMQITREEKIPYSRGLWIFMGYLATRWIVAASTILWLDQFRGLSSDKVSLATVYAGIFGGILAAGTAWLLVRHYYRSQVSVEGDVSIGLFPISMRQSVVSVLAGVALAAVAIALSAAFPSGSRAAGSAVDAYTMHGRALLYAWMIAGVAVAPFAEELLFRGWCSR